MPTPTPHQAWTPTPSIAPHPSSIGARSAFLCSIPRAAIDNLNNTSPSSDEPCLHTVINSLLHPFQKIYVLDEFLRIRLR